MEIYEIIRKAKKPEWNIDLKVIYNKKEKEFEWIFNTMDGEQKGIIKLEEENFPDIKLGFPDDDGIRTKVDRIFNDFKKNILQKYVPETTETNETNVTNETNETNVTNGFVSFVTCYKRLANEIFGTNTFDKILRFLAENKGVFTYDKIAENIGKSEGTVRLSIHRNKKYFDVTKPNGKICNTSLKQTAIEEIKSRIDQFKAIEANKKKNQEDVKNKELLLKNYNNELEKFTQDIRLKREGNMIYLDFNVLLEYNSTLADNLLDNPEKFLNKLHEHFDNQIDIQLLNLPDSISIPIENVRKDHLNRIICLDGRITSFGEVKPVIIEISYDCPNCGTIITIPQNYRTGQIIEPTGCSCGRKGGFDVNEKVKVNSCFLQLEDLQEKTDNPHSQRIKSVIFNGLTEPHNIRIFTPGNEVRVIGILKEVPIFKNNKKTIFLNWVLEIISAELIEKDIDISSFPESLVEEIQILSSKIDQEGIGCLIESFCPEVYGYDDIKIALALQLANRRNDVRLKKIRNKSNILLIGDPGCAKSVMCDFALDISSGGRKAVGGGSSAVGITASVVKEEDSLGGYRVEPGAMILAKDILFIDEINNLTEDDKPRLQEGMNEQRISIDKANLHVKMPVTCGILAAANPKFGNFKDCSDSPIQDQFNIPTPILNRFDTIFVLRDVIDEKIDKMIAKKMIKRHRGTIQNTYTKDFLKNFFAYIKLLPEPEIDDEIEEYLQEIYHLARKTNYNSVSINARFLESLNRMSIASAKLRQSNLIEKKDISLALIVLAQSQYKVSETITLEVKQK